MDPATIVYLLIAILSYFSSRKAGLSKGKSALVAAGVTGLAYKYDIGDKVADYFTGGDTSLPLEESTTVSSGSWLSNGMSWASENAGKLATGILGIAAAGGVASGAKKYWPWLLGGGVLLVLLTRGGRNDSNN